jgi:hypothetical protein
LCLLLLPFVSLLVLLLFSFFRFSFSNSLEHL